MGAGVLPVSLTPNGQLCFLFGREQDTLEWCDFGGGTESKESPLQTAVREASEELNGFYGTKTAMLKYVKQHMVTSVTYDTYTTFLVWVPYDPVLPFYFENNHKFLRGYLPAQVGKNGMFEKSKIEWMTPQSITQRRKQFRPFYRHIIDLIVANNHHIKLMTMQKMRA